MVLGLIIATIEILHLVLQWLKKIVKRQIFNSTNPALAFSAIQKLQQPPVQTDKPAPDAKDAVETASNGTAKDDKNAEQPKLQESSEQNNLKPGSECYVFSCIAMM
ncbi:hypothetical protein P8452_56462 [Trifolium repens]|nr:hypothetical protein P8452_56462 [Trifolium repens]